MFTNLIERNTFHASKSVEIFESAITGRVIRGHRYNFNGEDSIALLTLSAYHADCNIMKHVLLLQNHFIAYLLK